jgi:hypothetical protein
METEPYLLPQGQMVQMLQMLPRRHHSKYSAPYQDVASCAEVIEVWRGTKHQPTLPSFNSNAQSQSVLVPSQHITDCKSTYATSTPREVLTAGCSSGLTSYRSMAL